MKILHCIQNTVLIIHQSVYSIAGAISVGILKGEFEVLGIGFEFCEFFEDDLGQLRSGISPLPQSAQALTKLGRIETVK